MTGVGSIDVDRPAAPLQCLSRPNLVEGHTARDAFEKRPFRVAAIFVHRFIEAKKCFLGELFRILLRKAKGSDIETDDAPVILLVKEPETLVPGATAVWNRHHPLTSSRIAYRRRVKRLAFIVLLFCSCATACNKEEDTVPSAVWRDVEPRLSGSKRPSYETPRTATDAPDEECPEIVDSYPEALKILEGRRHCIDSAITALRTFAPKDRRAFGDIAAAYSLRAQTEENESDLLRALEAAERAVDAAPRYPAARFNLALIQEKLGLYEQAAGSWKTFLGMGRSDWTSEAEAHLRRLSMPSAAELWASNRRRLPAALKARDRALVRQLIAMFPGPALDWFERDLLRQGDPAAVNLLASELSRRLGGDRYVLDLAAAAPRAREGHAAYADAVLAGTNPDKYAQAARLLQHAGSPLYIAAEVRRVEKLKYESEVTDRGIELLKPLESVARQHDYKHLVARIRSIRGWLLWRQGRYLESFAESDAALDTFARLGDTEKVLSIQRNNAGLYREIGQIDLGWRESLKAVRGVRWMVDARIRNSALGEAALTAAALGYPRVALHYEEAAIRMIRKELVPTPELSATLKNSLASMLRRRAQTELQLGWLKDAEADVNEARRLSEENPNEESIVRAIQAGVLEVSGRSMLRLNPQRAIDAFTRALNIIPKGEMRTMRAALYAQRAEAARNAERAAEAANDLKNALRELREEETQMLKERRRGEGEQIWAHYFSRFNDTYERLIRYLVETGRADEAFDQDERSRAFEPLDLILQLQIAPETFKTLVPRGEPMSLGAVRRTLPDGTFLLHYAVLEDRTYTWIVSRNRVKQITQRATRNDVARWSGDLQRFARRNDVNQFMRGLQPPFVELMARPMSEAVKMADGRRPKRLVIIPDEAMHGLPFAALYDPNTRQHLVQKRIPIEIAGSATLYIFSLLRNDTFRDGTASALLIGDPAFHEQLDLARKLKRLPGAKSEVERIRGVYEPNVDVLVDKQATVRTFLSLAQNKTVIHVAAHAIVNPRQPWRSILLLARSGERTGAIEAQELLKELKLDQTRLFVLSACSSAGGLPVGPEGVAPLVRPLITAGVPAVMGSLWDVEDATAEALSVSFHRYYGRGEDAATALQAAQVEMLSGKNRGLKSVLAWAPFQVIGHASSPFESTQKREHGGTHLGIHGTNSVHRDDGVHPK